MKPENIISYLRNLWVLLPLLVLPSCESKTSQEIISRSPDGLTTIFINGSKPSFGDPWQAKIKIKTSADEKEMITEIYASELNNETVNLKWEANDKCRIVFSQQDDTKRNLMIEADSAKINLQEE
jgi:hypothetical protein